MKLTVAFLAALYTLGPYCTTAFADGGQVRLVHQRGNYQMTIFTSPTPLRAGPIDISVALQNLKSGEIVRDPKITIDLTSPHKSAASFRLSATRGAATNKLLNAALIDLPSDGVWNASVSAAIDETIAPIEAHFTMEVAPAWPAWISVWPWLTWPAIPVGLFLVHRKLVGLRLRARATTSSSKQRRTIEDTSNFSPNSISR